MSASLVGSEMCIRDRPGLVFPVAGGSVKQPGLRVLESFNAGLHDEFQNPVSYTHLTLPTICSV
eukprot:8763820-Alexandrium_andersonii.AAC.1